MEIPSLANTGVNSETFIQNRKVVTYTCDAGYRLAEGQTSPTASCDLFGIWTISGTTACEGKVSSGFVLHA